jgi:hypothetical protein
MFIKISYDNSREMNKLKFSSFVQNEINYCLGFMKLFLSFALAFPE